MSTMVVIPSGLDSVKVHWIATLPGSNNPVKRLKNVLASQRLENVQMHILSDFSRFLQTSVNVYGFELERGLMTDSILLTTSFVTPSLPSTAAIYEKIASLQTYASQCNALATNPPMKMSQPNRQGAGYITQVALPVNKRLAETNNFSIKRMVLGNNLKTMVTGPQHMVDSAFRAMYTYISDFSLSMPAIPFESLVTNRINEPDSNKWQTRVFFPIY